MSSILLDTHAFIWLSEDDPTLPSPLRDRIEQTDNVFVSIASFWEISIKLSLGKLALTADFHCLADLTSISMSFDKRSTRPLGHRTSRLHPKR